MSSVTSGEASQLFHIIHPVLFSGRFCRIFPIYITKCAMPDTFILSFNTKRFQKLFAPLCFKFFLCTMDPTASGLYFLILLLVFIFVSTSLIFKNSFQTFRRSCPLYLLQKHKGNISFSQIKYQLVCFLTLCYIRHNMN